jgi:hypothetical protein
MTNTYAFLSRLHPLCELMHVICPDPKVLFKSWSVDLARFELHGDLSSSQLQHSQIFPRLRSKLHSCLDPLLHVLEVLEKSCTNHGSVQK